MDKLLPTHLELSKKAVAIGLLASVALLQACSGHEAAAQHDMYAEKNVPISYDETNTKDGEIMCHYGRGPSRDSRKHEITEGDTIAGLMEQYPPIGYADIVGGIAFDAPTYEQIVEAIEDHNDVKAEELQIGDIIELPIYCHSTPPRY